MTTQNILHKEVIDQVFNKLKAEYQENNLKLSSFIKSTLFNKIVSTMIEKNIFLDEEDFRYFPEKTLEKFDIKELDFNSLDLFIDCMTDDNLIIAQSSFVEEDNCFDNITSEKLGLHVFVMYGQGCCIQIFPKSLKR